MTPPAFELERFEWRGAELEVSGRWRSERQRRFRHIRLVVDANGRKRKIAPSQPAPLRAGPEGEAWSAVFPWKAKDPPANPSLEVGTDLLVELPAPERAAVAVGAPDSNGTAPPADDLRAEVTALQATVGRLEKEIADARAALSDAEERAGAADTAAAEAREAVERLEKELKKEHDDVERLKEELSDRPIVERAQPRPRPTLRTYDPHNRPKTPLELPRTPSDPVEGEAPWAVRAVAIALAAGVVVMLLMLLAAIL